MGWTLSILLSCPQHPVELMKCPFHVKTGSMTFIRVWKSLCQDIPHNYCLRRSSVLVSMWPQTQRTVLLKHLKKCCERHEAWNVFNLHLWEQCWKHDVELIKYVLCLSKVENPQPLPYTYCGWQSNSFFHVVGFEISYFYCL